MDDAPRTRLQHRPARMVHRLRLAVEAGPDAGAHAAPDDGASLAVGTSRDNTLVLTDPTVSRYHLELRRTSAGVLVTDLGSRNGTWVGAVRVERAVVPAGTRLRLGDTTIIVEDAGSMVAPPLADAPRPADLIGDSDAIREVARLVHRLARVDSSVLIQGETGVGKEVIARALHEASPRRAHELVVVDCGSLPATLIASILFGHEKGSFTGADQRRARELPRRPRRRPRPVRGRVPDRADRARARQRLGGRAARPHGPAVPADAAAQARAARLTGVRRDHDHGCGAPPRPASYASRGRWARS